MGTYTPTDLVAALEQGLCRVIFKKKSNDLLRIMYCTWEPEVLAREKMPVENLNEGSRLIVWDIEKNGWRSFDLSTVIDFTPNIEKLGD